MSVTVENEQVTNISKDIDRRRLMQEITRPETLDKLYGYGKDSRWHHDKDAGEGIFESRLKKNEINEGENQ